MYSSCACTLAMLSLLFPCCSWAKIGGHEHEVPKHLYSICRCQANLALQTFRSFLLLLFVLACKISAPCEPWQVLCEAGELANPPVSATQPAGSHQQVMSPMPGQGNGTVLRVTNASGSMQTHEKAPSGGKSFEPMATMGRTYGGIDHLEPSGGSGGMQQVSTHTSRDVVHRVVPLLGVSLGGTPGPKTKTSSVSGAGSERRRQEGEGLLGG